MALEFQIVTRVQTRRTQYNKCDLLKAITDAGLKYTGEHMIAKVIVDTLEQRKLLEHNLKRVHRNVAYFVQVI